jgi:hypothetical protein
MELNEVMLRLFMIHPLLLVQSDEGLLPDEIEIKLLDWIWNRPEGIYYVTNFRISDYHDLNSKYFHSWLYAVELLSNFKHWPEYASGVVTWLKGLRGEDGLWDYGQAAGKVIFGHYSESWKNGINRKIDCSARILALLRKYHDKCLMQGLTCNWINVQ